MTDNPFNDNPFGRNQVGTVLTLGFYKVCAALSVRGFRMSEAGGTSYLLALISRSRCIWFRSIDIPLSLAVPADQRIAGRICWWVRAWLIVPRRELWGGRRDTRTQCSIDCALALGTGPWATESSAGAWGTGAPAATPAWAEDVTTSAFAAPAPMLNDTVPAAPGVKNTVRSWLVPLRRQGNVVLPRHCPVTR